MALCDEFKEMKEVSAFEKENLEEKILQIMGKKCKKIEITYWLLVAGIVLPIVGGFILKTRALETTVEKSGTRITQITTPNTAMIFLGLVCVILGLNLLAAFMGTFRNQGKYEYELHKISCADVTIEKIQSGQYKGMAYVYDRYGEPFEDLDERENPQKEPVPMLEEIAEENARFLLVGEWDDPYLLGLIRAED